MKFPMLLPCIRTSCSLVIFVASLCGVAICTGQTLPLEEFAVPADNNVDDGPTVAVEEASAADEESSGEETPDNSFFDEFMVEDKVPKKDDPLILDNDLELLSTDDEEKGPDSDTKEGDEPKGEPSVEDQGVDDLKPIPMPESDAEKSAEADPVTDQPVAERDPDVKQPSSWLSRGGSICSHWVRLTSEGKLRGEINLLQTGGPEQPVGSLKVAIYRNGKRVGEDVTNEAGQFAFREVKSGVYSLLVSGPGGFAAYGVHVLAPLEQSLFGDVGAEAKRHGLTPDDEEVGHRRRPHDDFVHFAQVVRQPPPGATVKETLRITTAAVPPTSFGALRSIIQDYGKTLTAKDTVPPESLPRDAWDDLIATAVKEKKPGFDEAEGPEMYRGTRELEKNPVKHVRSPALGNFNVPLERCGDQLVLCGRMVDTDPVYGRPTEVAEESTTLTLIRDDQRVATTVVGEGGTFEFRSLTPGIYSIVAVGDVGFGAISFRAVAPDKQVSSKQPNIHFVQQSLGAVTNDGCCCCDSTDARSGNAVIGSASVGGGGGGVAVPLCCDPACKRDAVAFFRPLLAAAGVVVPAIALATDDPVEFGGAPTSASGFQGTVGGGGGGGAAAGIGLGIGALGVGIAAALDDDEPVSPVLP